MLLAAAPTLAALALGEPFKYVNETFPVCAPDEVYTHDDECTKPPAGFAYHVGQLVPLLVQKCYTNWLDPADVTGYVIHRRLVSDQNGLAITMGDTFATVRKGCQTVRQSIHAVPLETPSGVYHLEGFSEVHVWRTVIASWRSVTFTVSSVPTGGS